MLAHTPIEPSTYFLASVVRTWIPYDLYTNYSVPKGAVAVIIAENWHGSFEQMAGIREKGSSLERIIDLHEAEAGGAHAATFIVQTDASDGTIEILAESTGLVRFRVFGYFEGCDFTEAFNDMGFNLAGTWEAKDLSSYGVPANAVVQIVIGNSADGDFYLSGLRAADSSLSRAQPLDEAEGGGLSVLSFIVKANSSSVIEWGTQGGTSVYFYLLGWFSSNVDFIEGWTDYSPGSKEDGVWVSRTLAEPPVSSIVAFCLFHQDSGNQTYCGLREYGSSQERKILEHEQEGGAGGGFQACITLDASKRCEVLCGDGSEAFFFYMGYFSEIVSAAGFKQLIFASEPPTGGAFNKLAYDSEPPTPNAWNKLKREA